MRIGVTTDALNAVDGGFHYEVVFLDALSELAGKFPAEFVCFPPPDSNLVLREQAGDASPLIDPRSPADLARAMLELWRSETLAAELAEGGRKRLAAYSWSAFVDGVGSVMSEACERVRAGRTPKFPDVDLGS